jgi:glycosyltransferase involved in cell wall biosynthesis
MKKKILLIAHFDQRSGWGEASNNIAEALSQHPDVDLACRTVSLSGDGPYNEKIIELHNKDIRGYEYCIQLLLPHHMQYAPLKKCIGMFYNETSSYLYSSWPTMLNTMDEIWVPYHSESHKNSGIKKPVVVINHPVDMDKYDKSYPSLSENVRNYFGGNFVFYFIGEMTKRKNIPAIIQAFHSEFDISENVGLIIKTSLQDKNAQKNVESLCDKIRFGLKLRKRYHKELIITQRLSEDELYSLHQSANCFVTASRGEAICLPMMDAIGFNKYIVAPNHTSISEILTKIDGNSCMYDTYKEPVYGEVDTFSDIYTGYEYWYGSSLFNLRQKMREAYTLWKNDTKPQYDRSLFKSLFSNKSISEAIVNQLDK